MLDVQQARQAQHQAPRAHQAARSRRAEVATATSSQTWDVVVIGAGAAGLAAASEAARQGARVLLVEKNERPGLKILISGGGHCNVTTTLGPAEAERHFAAGGRFLRHALRTTPPATIREWLHDGGVPTVEREFEKVWPASMRASDVLDVLLARVRAAGATLRTSTPVLAIEPPSDAADAWRAVLPDAVLEARALVLAVGGCSYPKIGTVGEGYRWLESLGLDVTPRVPALAPLRSDAAWVHALTGLTLQDVEVQLREKTGKIVFRRRRPLLFTHKGVSGPGPMDVSGRLEREPGRYRVHVDLLPEVAEQQLVEQLFRGASPVAPQLHKLGIPRRVVGHLVESLGIADTPRAQVAKRQRVALVANIKGLEIPIAGSLGFAKAEVTAGGLQLGQVDPKTMQVRAHPRLFVSGELLDVDGPIGGFSFLIAFATGVLAGRAAGAATPSG